MASPGPAAERCPRRLNGIGGVGLALGAAGLAVGAVDFDHLDAGAKQEPGQPRVVRAGAFHPDAPDGSEATHPLEQLGVARRGGQEGLDTEHAADGV